jgi:phosphate uptake regulator
MDSNDENEKRKYYEFKKDIKNEKYFLEKIKNLYDPEFEEMFQDILISSKEDFLDNISNNVNSILTDMYSEEALKDENLENILTEFDKKVEKDYNLHYEILNKCYKNFERENRRGKLNENNYLSNFRKHCSETDDIPYHNCQNNTFNKFYQI